MGNLGMQEILLILMVLLVPVTIYYLGYRSGYRKGQLDLYKKLEEDRKAKE